MDAFFNSFLIDLIFSLCFIYYGYKYRFKTPEFGDKNSLATRRARLNKENWALAHRFGGTLCLGFGVVLLIMIAIAQFTIGAGTWFDYVIISVEMAFALALIPLINLRLKIRMDKVGEVMPPKK